MKDTFIEFIKIIIILLIFIFIVSLGITAVESGQHSSAFYQEYYYNTR